MLMRYYRQLHKQEMEESVETLNIIGNLFEYAVRANEATQRIGHRNIQTNGKFFIYKTLKKEIITMIKSRRKYLVRYVMDYIKVWIILSLGQWKLMEDGKSQ